MAIKPKLVVGMGLALTGICTSGLAQEAPVSFPPESIRRGAELYAANCQSCHGVRMVGPQWGIDLRLFPREKRERFVDSVTYGRNAMPPWGDVLSSDEIAALWSYVVTGEK